MHPAGYQRILAAIDFSPSSADVVRQAAWMAERACCSLLLLHVAEMVRGGIRQASYACRPGYFANDPVKLTRQLRDQAEKRLEVIAVDLRQRGLNVEPLTCSGHPGAEIIAAAEREHVDLIVAGRRGFSRWKYRLWGSTARQLVHDGPCAVWAVRSPSQRWHKSVLAPVDFSPESGLALENAAWLAAESNCRLCALHVIKPPNLVDWFGALAGDARHTVPLESRTEAMAWEQLASFVKEHVARFREVKTSVVFGDPVQEIKRAAKRMGAGVIVIGNSTTAIPHLFGNSGAAETILDVCKCSVLVARARGEKMLEVVTPSAAVSMDETFSTRELERYRTGSAAKPTNP